jgi:hypothetical protein
MPDFQGTEADVMPKIKAAGYTGEIEHRVWSG